MTAEAYSHVLAPLVKDTPAFTVPKDRYDSLLEHFRDAELDMNASDADIELGAMRINYKAGGISRVCWFWCGHRGRMSFSWNGIRYVTSGKKLGDDESLAFDAIVRRIAKELQKEIDFAGGIDLIVFAPDTPQSIADRLRDLGYGDASFAAPLVVPIDSGNPYRSPRFSR